MTTKRWTAVNSAMTIKCATKANPKWSEWTRCDCTTKTTSRSRGQETEEKECPECEVVAEENEKRPGPTCHSKFCGDLTLTSTGQPTQFSYCKEQKCDRLCCPVVRVSIPVGYTAQAHRSCDYRLLPEKKHGHVVYQAFENESPKEKFLVMASYNFWVMSDSLD